MEYINWKELDLKDFISFISNLKRKVNINNDCYINDYPLMLDKINNFLNDNTIYKHVYQINSLEHSYRYIKSLSSLYKVKDLIDNKNNLSQEEINEIINNIYVNEVCFKTVCNSLGRDLVLVVNQLLDNNLIPSKEQYNEASIYLNNLLEEYNNSNKKELFYKKIYESNTINIKVLNEYFNTLTCYYTYSIVNKDFIKVYEEYPLSKIVEIETIIKGYKNYTDRVNTFLFNDKKVNEEYSFDVVNFVNEYDSYKVKDEFFSYLYINNNINVKTLNKYLDYSKKDYLKNYGTKYNILLDYLYKLDKICKDYKLFIDNLERISIIDKDIVNEYLNSKNDLDITFINLYTNNKLNYINIPTDNYVVLTGEKITRYSIIVNFLNHRLALFIDNDKFAESIILSNNKYKDIYYKLMNINFYKKTLKPGCKETKFRRKGLTIEERKLIDEYENKYLEYYNSNMKDVSRTSFVKAKVVKEKEDINIEELVGIIDILMESDPNFILLDYYKLCKHSLSTYNNLVRSHLPLKQKLFFNKFYDKYKNDIIIDSSRLDFLLNNYNVKYTLEMDSNGNVLSSYTITKEDKRQILFLLRKDDIPITNQTFNLMLRKYFLSIKDNIINSKKLIKK